MPTAGTSSAGPRRQTANCCWRSRSARGMRRQRGSGSANATIAVGDRVREPPAPARGNHDELSSGLPTVAERRGVAARRQVGAPQLPPVRTSKARKRLSLAPPMNTRPPAVTMAPPRFGAPVPRDPPGGERRYIAERHLPGDGARGQIDRVQQSPGRLLAGQVLAVPESSICPGRRRPAEWQRAALWLRDHLPHRTDLVRVHDQVRTTGVDGGARPGGAAHRPWKRQRQLAARRRVEPAAAHASRTGHRTRAVIPL